MNLWTYASILHVLGVWLKLLISKDKNSTLMITIHKFLKSGVSSSFGTMLMNYMGMIKVINQPVSIIVIIVHRLLKLYTYICIICEWSIYYFQIFLHLFTFFFFAGGYNGPFFLVYWIKHLVYFNYFSY